MLALASLILACNGSPNLCDRKYNEVVYPTTHNATSVMFDRHPVLFVPNQEKGVATQLREGIRAMMIDAWYFNGARQRKHGDEVWACHQFCALGGQRLQKPLQEIREFLENNPHEVLTIIFESYVSSKDMAEEFQNAGLTKYLAVLPVGGELPTLRQMISRNQRLVVLTDKPDHGPDWYMDVWSHAVETPFSFKKTENFTCDYNRGDGKNSLYILNHFLTKALFRRAFNQKPNKLKALLSRAKKCSAEKNRIPNFITVDFYRSSRVVDAAKILNASF